MQAPAWQIRGIGTLKTARVLQSQQCLRREAGLYASQSLRMLQKVLRKQLYRKIDRKNTNSKYKFQTGLRGIISPYPIEIVVVTAQQRAQTNLQETGRLYMFQRALELKSHRSYFWQEFVRQRLRSIRQNIEPIKLQKNSQTQKTLMSLQTVLALRSHKFSRIHLSYSHNLKILRRKSSRKNLVWSVQASASPITKTTWEIKSSANMCLRQQNPAQETVSTILSY